MPAHKHVRAQLYTESVTGVRGWPRRSASQPPSPPMTADSPIGGSQFHYEKLGAYLINSIERDVWVDHESELTRPERTSDYGETITIPGSPGVGRDANYRVIAQFSPERAGTDPTQRRSQILAPGRLAI